MNQSAVRVLLVDDSIVFRDAAADVVANTPGFELVGTAASGEEALALVASIAPDLVLMDHRMQGMSGLEAARKIRDAHPDTSVTIITADGGSRIEKETFPVLSKRRLNPGTLLELWRRFEEPSGI